MLVELERYQNGLWDKVLLDFNPALKSKRVKELPKPNWLEVILLFLVGGLHK